jgi:hypothetical protein
MKKIAKKKSKKIAEKKGKKTLQILAEASPKSFPLSKILAEKAEAIFNTGYTVRTPIGELIFIIQKASSLIRVILIYKSCM